MKIREYIEQLKNNRVFMFRGVTDKNPLEYKKNERMIFRITMYADNEVLHIPYAKIMVDSDDGRLDNYYASPNGDGSFTVETSLSCDGFLRVAAWACDEEKRIIETLPDFEGGAGVDISDIECHTSEPEDYLDFWNRVKQEAKSIPKEVIFEKELAAKDGFVAKELHFKSTAGDYASCVIVYPEAAEPKSLKLRFHYIGYAVTSVWLECFEDSLFVFTNAHDVENFREASYYEELLNTPKYKEYGFDREENRNPDTTYWKKVYIRNFQTFEYFMDHPLFDGKNIVFSGGSQGAFQACNMAAHTGVATYCQLIVPWFCDLFAFQVKHRLKGWRPEPDEGLRYFDTAIAARYLKCPVYIEAGLGDYICPPSGCTALYNSVSSPKKIDYIQGRTHSYEPPVRDVYTKSERYE